MKVCINIGHGRNGNTFDPGAINKEINVIEYDYVRDLAINIAMKWTSMKHELKLVFQQSYHTLPATINSINPDFIISLHLNGHHTRTASGTEMLYWKGSRKGKELAQIVYDNVHSCLDLKKRSNPVRGLTHEDRGGGLLMHTNAPCVIAESFFVTNNDDYFIGEQKIEELAYKYICAIDQFIEYLQPDDVVTAKLDGTEKKKRNKSIQVVLLYRMLITT